jgi:cytohesin
LYYFESISGKEPKGIIPLENVNVREVDDKTKQFCFEIYSTTNDKIKACKHDSEGKVVEVGNHAVYRMSAQTAEDKNEWIKRIRDCISENPLLNTTSKRKLNNAASAAANITTTNANNNTTSTTASNNANNTTLINNQHNSMSDSSLAATAAAVAAANNFNSTSSSAAALNGGAHHLTNNNK